MTSSDDKNKQKREFHWPYASSRIRKQFDTAGIEAQAIAILARGLRNKRLVAFVGSGASMVYGRLSWSGLMSALYDELKKLKNPHWEPLQRKIWEKGKNDFLAEPDHLIKAQILADLMDDKEVSSGKKLQERTNHYLKDFHGMIDLAIDRIYKDASSGGKKNVPGEDAEEEKRRRNLREKYAEAIRKNRRNETNPSYGLKSAISQVDRINDFLSAADLDISNDIAKPEEETTVATIKRLIESLTFPPIGSNSPMHQLALEWGISKYVTPNYDREIERSLEAFNLTSLEGEKPYQAHNHCDTINFGKNNTGKALCFALDGPRRHFEVLHIHGDVNVKDSLIITESHYQRLYLDEHTQRDLVSNSTLALFSANPILFVGSEVNEDDVLRSMRQFMEGPGHRGDRLAVALFVGIKENKKREFQKLRLLLKYGVHAIHVGEAYFGNDSFEPNLRGKELIESLKEEFWLHVYHKCYSDFKDEYNKHSDGWHRDGDFEKRLNETSKIFKGIFPKADETDLYIEGEKVDQENNFIEQLRIVNARLDDALALVNKNQDADFAIRKFSLLFEMTTDLVLNTFLCVKLKRLKEDVLNKISHDSVLPSAYSAKVKLASKKILSYTWDKRQVVALHRKGYLSRFCPNKKGVPASVDRNLDALCRAIPEKLGAQKEGLRLVVVCGSSGAGKGSHFDLLHSQCGVKTGALHKLVTALDNSSHRTVRHVLFLNMSFSNEIGAVVERIIKAIDVIAPTSLENGKKIPEKIEKDQLENLERGLHRLKEAGTRKRLLIVVGNAGVLFDNAGQEKNGQIKQLFDRFLSKAGIEANLDVVLYFNESQIPVRFRFGINRLEAKNSDARGKPRAIDFDDTPPLRKQREAALGDHYQQRQVRFGHKVTDFGDLEGRVLIHALRKTKVSELTEYYFDRGLLLNTEIESDRFGKELFHAVDGSRFAITIILAYLESFKDDSNKLSEARQDIVSRLHSTAAVSSVEAAVEIVLDAWTKAHIERRKQIFVAAQKTGLTNEFLNVLRERYGSNDETTELRINLSPVTWYLAFELMWHMAAFSHPVEATVFLACPEIKSALVRFTGGEELEIKQKQDLIAAALELLVHWCLAFRVMQRPGGNSNPGYRYAPHRHIQRHFFRLMGGRNIETAQWDNFSTSLYSAQPDEAPRMDTVSHQKLTNIVKALTLYPDGASSADEASKGGEAGNIRAAYFLLRASYSLAVISHFSTEYPAETEHALMLGHMEEQRRLVRWVTHAASYWDQAQKAASRKTTGIFFPGELVWLYNEAGIISLAQGKLQDAEQILHLAARSARALEADDSGSLHTRIRLHIAVVDIERGRPSQARQLLEPISRRQGAHKTVPLVAIYYLGLLEHIGGNYALAKHYYELSAAGFEAEGNSRINAFILMGLADLELSANPHDYKKAVVIADKAIGMAQQGGHEDVRILAVVCRVRTFVKAHQHSEHGLFEQLSYAQKYAVAMDIPRIACEAHEVRARLLYQQGEYRLSAAEATTSLEIAAMYDMKLKKARALLTLAKIYHKRGEILGASDLVKMGTGIANSAGYYTCVKGFKELEIMVNQAQSIFGSPTTLIPK